MSQQVEKALHAVAEKLYGARLQKSGRTLEVTPELTDGVKITSSRILINPAWAVEVGPIEGVERALDLCDEFDARLARSHADHRLRLKAELRALLHKIEAWNGPDEVWALLDDVLSKNSKDHA